MGQTTEGGEQTTYTRDVVRQIVEQRFYGETGRAIARVYYTSGKPFALIVQNMKYAVPLSVDNNGTVQSTEKHAYFLADNGVVCSWLLNGNPQPVDDNTIECACVPLEKGLPPSDYRMIRLSMVSLMYFCSAPTPKSARVVAIPEKADPSVFL